MGPSGPLFGTLSWKSEAWVKHRLRSLEQGGSALGERLAISLFSEQTFTPALCSYWFWRPHGRADSWDRGSTNSLGSGMCTPSPARPHQQRHWVQRPGSYRTLGNLGTSWSMPRFFQDTRLEKSGQLAQNHTACQRCSESWISARAGTRLPTGLRLPGLPLPFHPHKNYVQGCEDQTACLHTSRFTLALGFQGEFVSHIKQKQEQRGT